MSLCLWESECNSPPAQNFTELQTILFSIYDCTPFFVHKKHSAIEYIVFTVPPTDSLGLAIEKLHDVSSVFQTTDGMCTPQQEQN